MITITHLTNICHYTWLQNLFFLWWRLIKIYSEIFIIAVLNAFPWLLCRLNITSCLLAIYMSFLWVACLNQLPMFYSIVVIFLKKIFFDKNCIYLRLYYAVFWYMPILSLFNYHRLLKIHSRLWRLIFNQLLKFSNSVTVLNHFFCLNLTQRH